MTTGYVLPAKKMNQNNIYNQQGTDYIKNKNFVVDIFFKGNISNRRNQNAHS